MPRTTIDIVQSKDDTGSIRYLVRLVEPRVAGGLNTASCQLDQHVWPDPEPVRIEGEKLVSNLNSHVQIKDSIEDINNDTHGQNHTLRFQLGCPEDEKFYWETLCCNGQFLALKDSPPVSVVRVPGASADADPVHPKFSNEIRILALMSAFGRPAEAQWNQLADAAKSATDQGTNVRISVRVGERDLFLKIKQQKDAGASFIDDVAFIPKDPATFSNLFSDKRPHILHFYCHGMTQRIGSQELRMATRQDWQIGKEKLPLVLTTSQLDIARSTWLVVLNSCEGGQAGDGFSSIAYELVSEKLVPHVVAMLEEVEVADANLICGQLYRKVFERIKDRLVGAPINHPVNVDFSDLLNTSRIALRDKLLEPEKNRNWAIPSLYMQKQPFSVYVQPNQKYLDVVKVLEQAPNLNPDAIRAVIDGVTGLSDEERQRLIERFIGNP